MKIESKNLMQSMNEIGMRLDYIDVLLRDVLESFLIPIVHGKKGITWAQLVQCESEATLSKAEMLQYFIGQIGDHYRAMIPQIFRPDPIPDHRDMTKEDRIAEIMRDITGSVEQIAERADWLDRMKSLNGRAFALAYPDICERESTAPDALQVLAEAYCNDHDPDRLEMSNRYFDALKVLKQAIADHGADSSEADEADSAAALAAAEWEEFSFKRGMLIGFQITRNTTTDTPKE